MNPTSDYSTDEATGKAALDGFTDSMGKAREQITAACESMRPQLDALVIYIKDEPAKAVLISAAAGALAAALFAASRPRRATLPSASKLGAGMSSFVEAARSMAAEADDLVAGKASDAKKLAADEADDRASKGAKKLREARDSAAEAARKAAEQASESWADGLKGLREAGDNALGAARQKAESAYEDLTSTLHDLRGKAAPLFDRMQPPIDSVADYTKSSPFKALLIAAAAAAVVSRLAK